MNTGTSGCGSIRKVGQEMTDELQRLVSRLRGLSEEVTTLSEDLIGVTDTPEDPREDQKDAKGIIGKTLNMIKLCHYHAGNIEHRIEGLNAELGTTQKNRPESPAAGTFYKAKI